MAHKHSVYDSDTHLRINPTTRTFAIEGFTKNTIVQYDHNSERFTFELPRVIEGHDMLECNSVQVHYLNVDAKTQETSSGVFVVTDLQESPDDENIVIFSWLISNNATKYVGSLNFCIRFACISDENTVDYAWNTAVNTAMRVTDGINNAEIIIQEYADVLEQWKKEILKEINSSGTTWKDIAESPTGGDTLTWDGNTEGLVSVNAYDEVTMFHVSNVVPTKEELITTVTYKTNDGLMEGLLPETMTEIVQEDGYVFGEIFAVIPMDNYTSEAGTFPKKGIYLFNRDGMYISSLTINGYTGFPMIKPIDTKYLPEHLQFGSDGVTEILPPTELTLTVDDAGGLADPISQAMLTPLNLQEGIEYKVKFNNDTFNCVTFAFSPREEINFIMLGNGELFGAEGGNGEPFLFYESDGLVMSQFIYNGALETATLSISCEKIKPIDTKYLPKHLQFGIDYSSGETVVENKTYTYDAEGGAYALDFTIEPNCGYKVVVNGTEYEYVSQTFFQELGTTYYIGNGGPMDMGIEDNGEPIVLVTADMSAIGYGVMNMMVFADGSTNDVTMTVIKYTKINKLPSAYYDKVEPTHFYCNFGANDNDGYIYKDVECTEKLTYGEYESAMIKGNVYIIMGTQLYFTPLFIQKVLPSGSITQSYIAVTIMAVNKQVTLRTAEYTG